MEHREQWKRIEGYSYEVSDLGRIRRCEKLSKYSNAKVGGILKPWKSGRYLAITLIKDGRQYAFTVHRLVMETFIGERPGNVDIHHIDGNPYNNELSNLGYTTRSHNMLAAEHTSIPKLNQKQVNEINELRRVMTKEDLAKDFDCSVDTITKVLNNTYSIRWTER
jgi:hypothetical protein